MPTQQAYLPSMSELTQGGNPALGTVQPGVNYGENKGIDLLFRAATQEASYRWAKHQEIEQRKADVFKNIRDLSAVTVMPEDKQILAADMGNLLKQITDPSIFTGANEAARLKFESDTAAWGTKIHNSKQDFLNREIDKKTLIEHPEYENTPNVQYLDEYGKMPLGSREYNRLVPTPKVDYNVIIKAAQAGGLKDVEDQFNIGDYSLQNGVPQFKLNPNGHYTEVTSKQTSVDEPTVRANFRKLAGEPTFFSVIKPDLDFKFKYDLTPEQQKAVSNEDGSPNYEKMLQSVEDLAVTTLKSSTGEKKYEENKFLLQSQTEAGKNYRARLAAQSQTESPVTRNIYQPLVQRLTNPGEKDESIWFGQVGGKDSKRIGVALSTLPEEQANAILEIARNKNKKYNFDNIFVSYKDGNIVIVDKDESGIENPKEGEAPKRMAVKDIKNWQIPKSAIIATPTQQALDLIANQTLGNKSQTEIVKEGQKPPVQKVQRVIVDAEDF